MHINYTMHGTRRSGGTVTFLEIGKRLIKRGHRVTITCLDDHTLRMTSNGLRPNWELDSPIEYIRVEQRAHRFLRSGIRRLNSYGPLQRLLPELKYYAMAELYKNIGGDMLRQIPDCDVNVATYFPTAFSVVLSEKGKVQFYHMQHYEPLFFNPKVDFGYSELAKISYALPLSRIANCSWLQRTVKEKHGVDSTVINHAIRNEVFYPRPEVEKSERRRILCLGKTSPSMFWKGVQTLTDALRIVSKKHPNIELVMYGEERNPRRDFPFEYVLNPPSEKLAELYCSSHIVICPSWYESFPAPPLEAMACGVPVVTTSIGVEDYAIDGKNALVVPARNPKAMAYAIDRLLSDERLCEALVKEGLNTAKQFTWDKTADNVERLFEDALRTVRET